MALVSGSVPRVANLCDAWILAGASLEHTALFHWCRRLANAIKSLIGKFKICSWLAVPPLQSTLISRVAA